MSDDQNYSNPLSQSQSVEAKPKRSKKLLLIIILLLVVGGGVAAAVMSGMLGGGSAIDQANSPGFGQPGESGDGKAVNGAVGQPEEGPFEELGTAPGITPATPAAPAAYDEAATTQQCTDKFNNDIRARGQNPDDFATARGDYVKQCVDFVRQQSAGK